MSPTLAVRRRAPVVAGLVVAPLIFVLALLWSKWLPYEGRIRQLGADRAWSGGNILETGGVRAGDAPSWPAATGFTWAYLQAVWKALVSALLISAAVLTLVPRTWLLRVLNRPGRLSGALASTPSMMCACCSAPVAVSLRRGGVSTSAVIAYWLGNPLLNPAVLVFLVLVAPWEWTVTRLVVGVLVVVGGAALVARITDGRAPAAAVPTEEERAPAGAGALAARYGRALARLSVTLVPEYLLVVMLIGGFRGRLLALFDGGLGPAVLVVLVAAVAGTLLVIPTAAEIPILQGLALAGLSLGGIGALLVTLPAVSLPGIAMVGRAFGWRVTAATAGVVAAGGALAAAVITLL